MKRIDLVLTAIATLTGIAGLTAMSRREPVAETVDFAVTRTATTPAFDARVAPATGATVRTFRIPVTHDTIEIADLSQLRRLLNLVGELSAVTHARRA